MSEAQKGGSPIAGSKKKDLLFDEDIGKEFLSSWKSNTGGDDALDFTPDTVSRGRKNTFTLDKLDMDFTFDGGFDKLSSFKVDMSDLDFSSPPRTDQKPKEGSGKESVLGRQEVNKERFSFNFDFKELDGFDLDSTLLKGGERSGKCAIDKEPDCSAKCLKNQDVRNNLEENIAKSSEKNVIGKLPSLDNIAGSKFKLLMGSLGEFETPQKEVAVRIPAQGKFISSHDLMNYPPKQTYIGEEESMREGSTIEQSEIICSKPDVPLPISDSIDQSIPVEDSTPVIVSELKTGLCTSDSEVNTNTGRDQDDTVNSMPSSHFVNNSSGSLYNLKCLPSKYTSESQNTGGATGKLLHDRKDSNVGNQDSVSNVLQLTLHRDSRDENLVEMKGAAATCSNFLDKSEDSQVNLASTAKQVYGLRERKMGITHLGPSAIEESPKSKTNGGQAGNQNVVSSVSDRRAVKKSIPTVLGSERNDKDRDSLRDLVTGKVIGKGCKVGTLFYLDFNFGSPSCTCFLVATDEEIPTSSAKCNLWDFSFLSDPARTPEQKSVFGLPKSIISRPSKISSLAPVVNSKTVFIERKAFSPLKTEKMRDISSLKISRKITSNGDTSLSTLQKETKSSASKGIMAVHVSFPSKKAHSITTEKSVLFSPSLKRTSIERLTPDALTLNPLKRAMESPLESRKLCKYSPVMESKMVLEIENIKDTPKNVNFEQPSPILDIPLESSMPGLEVPGLIENDGNVEKAEACAKELENICNMLKKKHEEAKELLVRAVVNNNLLLMLNHPRYEEKIHLMQRYAASLGLKEY